MNKSEIKGIHNFSENRHPEIIAFWDKAVHMCRTMPVGREMTVRLSPKSCVSGEVVAARPAYVEHFGAGGMRVVFAVDMLCGVARVARTINLNKIPS